MIRPTMAPDDGPTVVDDIDRDAFFRRTAASWANEVPVFRNVAVLGLN